MGLLFKLLRVAVVERDCGEGGPLRNVKVAAAACRAGESFSCSGGGAVSMVMVGAENDSCDGRGIARRFVRVRWPAARLG